MLICLLLASDMPQISIHALVDQLDFWPQESPEFHQVVNQVCHKINDQNINSELISNLAHVFKAPLKPEEREEIFAAIFDRLKLNGVNLDLELRLRLIHDLFKNAKESEFERLNQVLGENIINPEVPFEIFLWFTKHDVVYRLSDETKRKLCDVFLRRINDPHIPLNELIEILNCFETVSQEVNGGGVIMASLDRFADRISRPDVTVEELLQLLSGAQPRTMSRILEVLVARIPSMNLMDLAMVMGNDAIHFANIAQAVRDRVAALTDVERIELNHIQIMDQIIDPNTDIDELVDIMARGSDEESQAAKDALLERINNPATPINDLLYITVLRNDEIKLALEQAFNARRHEFTIDLLHDAQLSTEFMAIYKFLPEDQKQQAVDYLLGLIEAGTMSRGGGEAFLGIIQDRILFDVDQTRRAAAALERLAVLPTPGAAGEDATEVHKFIKPIWDKFVAKLKGLSDGLQQMPFGAARRQLQRHIGQLDEPMRRQAQVSFKRLKKCVNLMQNFRDMWPEIVSVLNDDNQPWNPELLEARSTDGRWVYYLLNSFSASGEAYMRAEAGGEGSYSCPEGILERLATGFWGLHQELDLEKLGKTFLNVEEKLDKFLTSLQDSTAFLSAKNKAELLGYLLNNFRTLYSVDDESWGQLMRNTQTKRDYFVALEAEEKEA